MNYELKAIDEQDIELFYVTYIGSTDFVESRYIFELTQTEDSVAQETLELLQAIASQTNNSSTTVPISGSFVRGASRTGSWTPENVTLGDYDKIEFLKVYVNSDGVNIYKSHGGTTNIYTIETSSSENWRTFYGPATFWPKNNSYQRATQVDYVITRNSPIIQTSIVTNTITNNLGYTLSDIADMRVGSQMVSVSNNNAKLRFELDMSDDLMNNWETNVQTIEVDMPTTNDVQFFRLRMD